MALGVVQFRRQSSAGELAKFETNVLNVGFSCSSVAACPILCANLAKAEPRKTNALRVLCTQIQIDPVWSKRMKGGYHKRRGLALWHPGD